jgi:hypothetical protein
MHAVMTSKGKSLADDLAFGRRLGYWNSTFCMQASNGVGFAS